MNLYVFTRNSNKEVVVVHVIADNQEHAKDILKNDGHNPRSFEIETWYPLSAYVYVLADSGIPYSITFEFEEE